MAAAQNTENYGDEWGLTWYLQWGIYTLIRTFTHLQNALAAAEALSLTIFIMEHLSNDHKTIPISTRINIIYAMKLGILF